MRMSHIAAAALIVALSSSPILAEVIMPNENHAYVGLWVTRDGHVRHELLPNSRYDEARGTRESAYRGRYVVTGDHIDYWDDTGFTADGDFIDGVLHDAGMIFYRKR